MQVIPFGNVIEARMDLSKKYNLVECRGSIWLLTQKCRDNYDSISYIEYLRGQRELPEKIQPKPKKEDKESDVEDIFEGF